MTRLILVIFAALGAWAAFGERDVPEDTRALSCEVRYTTREEIAAAGKDKRAANYFTGDRGYQVIKPLRAGKAIAKVSELPFSYEAIFSGGVLYVRASCPGMKNEFFSSEATGSTSFTKSNCGEGDLTVASLTHSPDKPPVDHDPKTNPYLAIAGVYCEVK